MPTSWCVSGSRSSLCGAPPERCASAGGLLPRGVPHARQAYRSAIFTSRVLADERSPFGLGLQSHETWRADTEGTERGCVGEHKGVHTGAWCACVCVCYTLALFAFRCKHLAHTQSQFKPTLVVCVVRRLGARRMLDFSAGWGDRLVGAIAAGLDKYVATDPNVGLRAGHDAIKEAFCPYVHFSVSDCKL